MTAVGEDGTRAGPILVLGISHRSGTNFLWRLLLCHEDCVAPRPLLEDFLLAEAHHLERYVQAVAAHWNSDWGDLADMADGLMGRLGDGLRTILEDLAGTGRVVAKTPSPRNLRLLPRLLPDATPLVLVRDGRSVAESAVEGLGMSYEEAFERWRFGARHILEYLERHPETLVVRYEELVEDTAGTLQHVLTELGLSPQRFDWTAAEGLPVYGSSFQRGDRADVHWQPVERPGDFASLERYSRWGPSRHARFNWVAGRESAALGYPLVSASAPVRNRVRDVLRRIGTGS